MLESLVASVSRRAFLAGAAATLAAPILEAADAPKVDGYVDAHSHVWTDDVAKYPLVNDQGKESINCQISYTLYFIVGGLLLFVVIGIIVLPVLWLVDVILVIIASIKANEGVRYRYPGIIRFIN